MALQVPVDSPREPGFEGLARLPAKLNFSLPGVDRIAPIMPRPIRNEFDQFLVTPAVEPRALLIEKRTEHLHDLQIRPFRSAPDQVSLSNAAFSQHRLKRAGMILDVEPVANVLALPVNRKLFLLDRIEDDERDKLLRKLVRTVIV